MPCLVEKVDELLSGSATIGASHVSELLVKDWVCLTELWCSSSCVVVQADSSTASCQWHMGAGHLCTVLCASY